MKTFLLIIFLTVSNLSAQQITFPQDTIARNDLFNNREFPAYNSNGKVHVTYTGQLDTDGSTREIYYASEQSDGSFSTINITNNSVDDNYSTLSIDSNDKVHVGYTGRDGANLFQIKYITNFSGAFTAPIEITQGGLNKATPYSKIGPDSVMHFVYFTYTNDPDFTYYRSYDLRTSTLSPVVTLVQAETGGDFDSGLDVDLNGKVHVVVKSGSIFGGPLKYYNSTSGTLTETPTGVTASVTNPKVEVDKNNVVHIIYRDEADKRLYYINNQGGSFSSPVAITPIGQRPATYQNIDVDDSLRVYIVYQSSVSTSGKGFYMVYGSKGIFSDTIKVYEITSEYLLRNSSAVIAKGNGEIALFYAPSAMRNSNVVCDIFMKRGPLFDPVPVELVSFSALVEGTNVTLKWETASETNNRGFEIERAVFGPPSSVGRWEKIGFVEGKGTTTLKSSYTFNDDMGGAGSYAYRLVQQDYDGVVKISNAIEVEIKNISFEFSLEQNYPNPFNPTTKIKYSISSVETHSGASPQNVLLKVYDVLGNEIATLVNEEKVPGVYEVEFSAEAGGRKLSSGIYFYKLQAGNFTAVKKLVLMK